MSDQMIGRLVERTLRMYHHYENARPVTRQLFEAISIQDPKMQAGVFALREVLALFEQIYQERQVMRSNLQEQAELEEGFWNEMAQVTTLVANLDVLVNDPGTLAHILDVVDPRTLEALEGKLSRDTKNKVAKGLRKALR